MRALPAGKPSKLIQIMLPLALKLNGCQRGWLATSGPSCCNAINRRRRRRRRRRQRLARSPARQPAIEVNTHLAVSFELLASGRRPAKG